jgi:diadenosine tetraphosphatase ApaH/serine/threonine PP2A family protein phosphatase
MDSLDSLASLNVDPLKPFAILADIHGNAEALGQVEAWLDDRGIAEAVVLGDVIGYGASPETTLRSVRKRGWAVVRGNHEDMLLDDSYVKKTRSLNGSARRALDWTRARLLPEDIEYLEDLPLAARIGDEIIAIHGSLVDDRNCYAYIYEFSIDLNARRLQSLNPPAGTLVLFGHTHSPALIAIDGEAWRELDLHSDEGLDLPRHGAFFINPGSVGFSRDGDPRSSFLVFDPLRRRLEHVRLEYDIEAAAEEIRKSGYDPTLADRLLRAR